MRVAGHPGFFPAGHPVSGGEEPTAAEREAALVKKLNGGHDRSDMLVKVVSEDDAYYVITRTDLGSGRLDDVLRFRASDRLTLEQAEKWADN